jgi:hypothetical protein
MPKITYLYEPVSDERREATDRQRRSEHHIANLAPGFTLKPRGRDGFIYYSEGGHVLELYYELAAGEPATILLNWDGLRRWVWPAYEDVAQEDQARIKKMAVEWSPSKGAVIGTP